MFDLFLKIFLLLSPIFILPYNGLAQRFQWFQFGNFSSSISLLQLQFFQYGTIFLFLIALFEKPKRIFQDGYLGILFLFCILGVCFHPVSIKIFHNVFIGFLLYYLVVSYTKDVKSILKFVVVVSALNTIFSILQFFDIHLIYNRMPQIIGLMSYKSHLGIYQALAIPICYALNPWLSLIPIIGILLSKSVTAIIPAVIGMAYLLRDKIHRFKGMPNLMLLFSCIILFGSMFFYKLSLRFDVWIKTLKMINENIIYGHGIGVFKYVSSEGVEFQDPYNLYLSVAYALGMFGLIAFLIFIISKFVKSKNNEVITNGLIASCLILVISGLGYSFLNYPRLAGTAIILFGLLTVKKGEYYG